VPSGLDFLQFAIENARREFGEADGEGTMIDKTTDAQAPWTLADQQAVDTFEQQILEVAAQIRGGHPDALVVGVVQALGSLMAQRLRDDPTRVKFYAQLIARLADHVMPAPSNSSTPRH